MTSRVVDQLGTLDELHRQGVLSDTEYEAARARVSAQVDELGTDPEDSENGIDWDDQWDEWRDLDEVGRSRFPGASFVSRLLLVLAVLTAVLGIVGSIVTAASISTVSSQAAVGIGFGSVISVAIVSGLLAAAGYGLRALVATWCETWQARIDQAGDED